MNLFKRSKIIRILFLFVSICVAGCFGAARCRAQQIEAKIKVLPQARVAVEGKFSNEATAENKLSFLKNYADVADLGSRIENLQFYDARGGEIEYEKIGAAEFRAKQIPARWKYEVRTAVSTVLTDAAHVSWSAEKQGLLLTHDLLPQISANNQETAARISFELPENWKIATTENAVSTNVYDVKSIENAVFLVGENWRARNFEAKKTRISFATTGEWAFTDEEAAMMIDSIFAEHAKVFGTAPVGQSQLILLPFPQADVAADRWRAETRGATATILSGVIAPKNRALQRLHEQLRHEIFHLWLPNAVNLSGDYSWFYEGFTIYRALRTGVELNQIRFDDYLDTLSRAYDIVRRDAAGKNLSLIEASQMRWTNSNNHVYAKGLLVAFLCDVALLGESRGKRDLTDVFRALYRRHHDAAQIEDGNRAVLRILKSFPELTSVTEKYIEGKAEIEWREFLQIAGIETAENSATTRLKVTAKPNKRQQDLLNDLGYNQWRKLLREKK